jgi:predicted N-formylglutamate amidohydrolase
MTAPRILRPQGSGRCVFFCDHASTYIPAELHDLGLPTSEIARPIAWDIGTAAPAADQPAILSCFLVPQPPASPAPYPLVHISDTTSTSRP